MVLYKIVEFEVILKMGLPHAPLCLRILMISPYSGIAVTFGVASRRKSTYHDGYQVHRQWCCLFLSVFQSMNLFLSVLVCFVIHEHSIDCKLKHLTLWGHYSRGGSVPAVGVPGAHCGLPHIFRCYSRNYRYAICAHSAVFSHLCTSHRCRGL
jgi:hypothetical protein